MIFFLSRRRGKFQKSIDSHGPSKRVMSLVRPHQEAVKALAARNISRVYHMLRNRKLSIHKYDGHFASDGRRTTVRDNLFLDSFLLLSSSLSRVSLFELIFTELGIIGSVQFCHESNTVGTTSGTAVGDHRLIRQHGTT